nr:Putative ATP-dependent RNA helicase DHX30 [Ipomoea batatas]
MLSAALSVRGSPTREIDDLVERSVKKKKIGDNTTQSDGVEVVPETPEELRPENMLVDDGGNEFNVSQKSTGPNMQAKPSYLQSLTGEQVFGSKGYEEADNMDRNKRIGRQNSNIQKEAGVSTRFNALYGLEDNEEIQGVETFHDLEEPQDNGNQSMRTNIQGKGKRPQVQVSEKQIENDKNTKQPVTKGQSSKVREESSRSGTLRRSKQAAAEAEHVVVRGSQGGKSITRTVVETEGGGGLADSLLSHDAAVHHQDPPFFNVEEREAMVQDYWNEEKGWDEYLFQGILPDVVLDRLMAFTLSTEKDVHDELLWAPESSVRVIHIHREQNNVADWLAKKALAGSRGLSMLSQPETGILELLVDDSMGVPRQRVVSIVS